MADIETIEVRLARLEEKTQSGLSKIQELLTAHLGRVDERCVASCMKLDLHDKRLNKHSDRLDMLEGFKARCEGGWSTIAVVASASAAIGGVIVSIAGLVFK